MSKRNQFKTNKHNKPFSEWSWFKKIAYTNTFEKKNMDIKNICKVVMVIIAFLIGGYFGKKSSESSVPDINTCNKLLYPVETNEIGKTFDTKTMILNA
jgi:uncharacterized membrane protein (UPF0182 family)